MEKLTTHHQEIRIEGIDKPLIENVEDVEEIAGAVSFKFLFDYSKTFLHRGDPQKVAITASADVKIVWRQGYLLYLMYPTSKIADSVRPRLSKALTKTPLSGRGDAGFIKAVEISPKVMKELLLSDDIVELKKGKWAKLETTTDEATLSGNLRSSSYYSDFTKKGEPRYLRFESQTANRTVLISSQGSLSFIGTTANRVDMENYVLNRIISKLESES